MKKKEEKSGYEKIDSYHEGITNSLSEKYKSILTELGEDVKRQGLEKTPVRVARSMQFLTHGYNLNPADILKSAMFSDEYKQMVLVKDIEIYSLCEHHLLPFYGKAHVRSEERRVGKECRL